MPTHHPLPREAVTPEQAAPPEEAGCEVGDEGQPMLLPRLGVTRRDAFHHPGQALLVGVGGGNRPRRQNVCDSA